MCLPPPLEMDNLEKHLIASSMWQWPQCTYSFPAYYPNPHFHCLMKLWHINLDLRLCLLGNPSEDKR